MAESVQQSRDFWNLREHIPLAQVEGKNIKHDIAVPISRIADFIEATDALLQQAFPGARMVTFGHLGDGNLHYNVSPPAGTDHDAFLANQAAVNQIVHDSVHAHRGSISAEHGLGQLKREENQRHKSEVELAMMRAIKQALDPLGLMNPGRCCRRGTAPSLAPGANARPTWAAHALEAPACTPDHAGPCGTMRDHAGPCGTMRDMPIIPARPSAGWEYSIFGSLFS